LRAIASSKQPTPGNADLIQADNSVVTDEDPLVVQRQRFWLNGGSAVPLLELLLEQGRVDDAAATARLALAMDGCLDREMVERILREAGSPPVGWDAALEAYADDPTDERWDDLMRFIPEDVVYQRLRNMVAQLRALGAEANRLFLHVSRFGIVAELLEMGESGEVDPETIRARGDESPENRSFWLGLAAQAAFARGERFLTVRLLAEAYDANAGVPADLAAMQIREAADDALHAMMDAVGIPRFDDPA
jgi:hypothetical protein